MSQTAPTSTKVISTPEAFIERLGGTGKCAELFGFSPSRVSNWKVRGLPQGAEFYVLATSICVERGFELDAAALFGIARKAS